MVVWTAAVLIVVGSLFSVLAAVGILRMPDVYMRAQAATKSATLGVCSLALAAMLLTPSPGASARALLIIAFLLLTAPIAAHMICRAAYTAGVTTWEKTEIDELREQADHDARESRI